MPFLRPQTFWKAANKKNSGFWFCRSGPVGAVESQETAGLGPKSNSKAGAGKNTMVFPNPRLKSPPVDETDVNAHLMFQEECSA